MVLLRALTYLATSLAAGFLAAPIYFYVFKPENTGSPIAQSAGHMLGSFLAGVLVAVAVLILLIMRHMKNKKAAVPGEC